MDFVLFSEEMVVITLNTNQAIALCNGDVLSFV
jgi:hypothetical protein